MNKNIKYLVENIFTDKDFIEAQEDPGNSSIRKIGDEILYQNAWMPEFIYKCYKDYRIPSILEKVTAADTFSIPFASFDVWSHFGNKLYSTGENSLSDFIKTLCGLFKGKSISLNWLNMKGVTELNATFKDVKDITVDISEWDVSSVLQLWSTFEGSDFSFDATGWDLSSCIRLLETFSNTKQISKSIGTWKFGNLLNLIGVFRKVNGETFEADISGWDVSKVTTLEDAFSEANIYGLLSDSLEEWNILECRNFTNSFYKTKGYVNLAGWKLKAKNVILDKMFYNSEMGDAGLQDWKVKNVVSLKDTFAFSNFIEDLSGWIPLLSAKALSTINALEKQKIYNYNTLSQTKVQRI